MVLGLLDQLTVVSDRITRAFNRPGATWAVALDISKAFDRVWYAGLLHKLRSCGNSGQIFGLVSSFLSNRQLQVVLDGKSSQEYPVNAGVPQGSILGPTLFLLYINDLADDVICNIAIYAVGLGRNKDGREGYSQICPEKTSWSNIQFIWLVSLCCRSSLELFLNWLRLVVNFFIVLFVHWCHLW